MPGWTSADIRKMKKAGAYNPYGSLGPSPGTVARVNARTPQFNLPQIKSAYDPTVGFGPQYNEPNWAALIAGDPDYGAAESEINAMNKMDRGNLRDAIRRAVVESGLDIAADEDIDEGTRAAARNNQFSSAADIANQLRRGAATSDAELASRGLLSSGQFTENRSVLQKSADTARNQLQNALLNTIASGRNQYASTVADRNFGLRQLRETIASRLAQNPGIWQSNPNPAWGGGYGNPFAPLGNASAQQMWQALQSTPAARRANAALISGGYDAFLRNYGSQFGGGGGAAPSGGGGGGGSAGLGAGGPWASLYAKYGAVPAGNDADGRPYVMVNGQKRYS